MKKFVTNPTYKLSNVQRKYIKLLAADNNLKWIKRKKCLCGSAATNKILDRDRYDLIFSIMLCEDCGLIYFAEVLDENSITKYYNTYFTPLINYQDGTLDEAERIRQYKFIEPHIIARFAGKKLAILDIGTGSGKLLKTLRDNFSKIGIQTDLAAFELDKSWHPALKEEGIRVIKSLKSKKKHYNLIILSHTLEHLVNPIDYLKNLKALLSPLGMIFIEVFSIFNLHNLKCYEYDFKNYCPHFHFQSFNSISLINLASLASLYPVEVTEHTRALFCRGTSKPTIPTAMLTNNAQRIRTYLKYVKQNKQKWKPLLQNQNFI